MTREIPNINIYLTFKDFKISPGQIGDMLGIKPLTLYEKGETTKSGRISQTSFWSSPLLSEDSWSVGDSIESVIESDTFTYISKEIQDIGGKAWLAITISFTKPPSIYVPQNLMNKLANLNIDLDIDLFYRDGGDIELSDDN